MYLFNHIDQNLICKIFVYENRGKHSIFRGKITINPDYDNARVIYAMNMGFELAAERFSNDQNHGVYAYGR